MRPSETVETRPGAAVAGRAAAPDKASESGSDQLIRRTFFLLVSASQSVRASPVASVVREGVL